ncbi:hypothetical protein vBVpPvVp04M_00061 [Vibrio phage vB_Vp_PvVp04_M]|nr:hypothetical protein vBVpPvVp04M_00061 [Vibrio phage vB_Vp_PvVp04_M]
MNPKSKLQSKLKSSKISVSTSESEVKTNANVLSSESVKPRTEETKPIQQAVKQQFETEYSADSIKILNSDEAEQKFEWLQVGKLADKFNASEEFIERGLECCRRISFSPEFFVNRYLLKDGTPFSAEFEAVYKEILNDRRMALWTAK